MTSILHTSKEPQFPKGVDYTSSSVKSFNFFLPSETVLKRVWEESRVICKCERGGNRPVRANTSNCSVLAETSQYYLLVGASSLPDECPTPAVVTWGGGGVFPPPLFYDGWILPEAPVAGACCLPQSIDIRNRHALFNYTVCVCIESSHKSFHVDLLIECSSNGSHTGYRPDRARS